MRATIRTARYLFFLSWGVVAFLYGRNVPISTQESLFDALRNMSAVIFAIMGAWIAVLHPDLLTRLTRPEKVSDTDMPNSHHLIEPMVYAALGLAFVMLVQVLRPVAAQFSFLVAHLPIVRGLLFSSLSSLALLQIWALVLSFVPYFRVKIRQERKTARKQKARILARTGHGGDRDQSEDR